MNVPVPRDSLCPDVPTETKSHSYKAATNHGNG
jgi:hypothetical protein